MTLPPRREARELALGVAAGRIGLIEGSVRLARLRWEVEGTDAALPDLFTPFVGVSSETDHLPLAEHRVHWNADALRAKDGEARAYERRARPYVVAACRALAAALDGDAARETDFFTPRS